MSRAKGVRLWLRPERKEGTSIRPSVWIIRDGNRQISTGLGANQNIDAEAELIRYLSSKSKNQSRTLLIYFITAKASDFPIKIGITTDHSGRFSSMQTALPYEIEVLGLFPIMEHEAERLLHKKFARLRLRGEWFSRDKIILDFIESLKPQSVRRETPLLVAATG